MQGRQIFFRPTSSTGLLLDSNLSLENLYIIKLAETSDEVHFVKFQIYKLELEQKRLEEDAFVYNSLQYQLKLSPAYKKVSYSSILLQKCVQLFQLYSFRYSLRFL